MVSRASLKAAMLAGLAFAGAQSSAASLPHRQVVRDEPPQPRERSKVGKSKGRRSNEQHVPRRVRIKRKEKAIRASRRANLRRK